jgi:alpha-tubulin suppressor-like RCC1 family protein
MGRRLAVLASLAIACGGREQHVVPVSASAGRPAAETPPALVQQMPFELVIGSRTCVLVHGILHCQSDSASVHWLPEAPLASEATLAGSSGAITSASFGYNYGCVTTRAGTVTCFGYNYYGQLGAGLRAETHDEPIEVRGVRGATRVVAGPSHACAILRDGKVSCWGKNEAGETGSSTNYVEAARELVEPEIVAGITDVTDLALTGDATCAVTSAAQVWCWGDATHPEQKVLGPSNEHPTHIVSLDGASSLTANSGTFCAIKNDKILCWGDVARIAPNATRDAPKTLDIAQPRRVRLGSSYGCALDAHGDVYCFGHNSDGELGIAPESHTWVALDPMKVEGIPRAVDVMCGVATSCALTASDELWCWGRFAWNGPDGINGPTKMRVL